MKNKYFILIGIVLIAGAVFTGCSGSKENVNQANEDLKVEQAQYEKEWQQFKSEAELKIDANQKSIDELKAEIKTASSKFKAKYEKEVIALEQKNVELKKKISEYKYEGKDKWAQFKQEFNRDIDIVGNAIKNIFTKKD